MLSKDSTIKWKKQNQHNKNKKLLLFTPYCHSKNITLSSLLLFSPLASSFSTALEKWKWNYIFIFAALIHTPPIYVKTEDLFSPREWASSFFYRTPPELYENIASSHLWPDCVYWWWKLHSVLQTLEWTWIEIENTYFKFVTIWCLQENKWPTVLMFRLIMFTLLSFIASLAKVELFS